jgi:hypothetical protein
MFYPGERPRGATMDNIKLFLPILRMMTVTIVMVDKMIHPLKGIIQDWDQLIERPICLAK